MVPRRSTFRVFLLALCLGLTSSMSRAELSPADLSALRIGQLEALALRLQSELDACESHLPRVNDSINILESIEADFPSVKARLSILVDERETLRRCIRDSRLDISAIKKEVNSRLSGTGTIESEEERRLMRDALQALKRKILDMQSQLARLDAGSKTSSERADKAIEDAQAAHGGD